MAKEGKKPVYSILNKVDGTLADKIMAKVNKERVIGVIPFSKSVQERGLTGEALDFKLLSMTIITSFVLRTLQSETS